MGTPPARAETQIRKCCPILRTCRVERHPSRANTQVDAVSYLRLLPPPSSKATFAYYSRRNANLVIVGPGAPGLPLQLRKALVHVGAVEVDVVAPA